MKIPYSLNFCCPTIRRSYILLKILGIPVKHRKDLNFERKSSRKGEHVVFSWILLHELSKSLRFCFGFCLCYDALPKIPLCFPRNRGIAGKKMWFLDNLLHVSKFFIHSFIFFFGNLKLWKMNWTSFLRFFSLKFIVYLALPVDSFLVQNLDFWWIRSEIGHQIIFDFVSKV